MKPTSLNRLSVQSHIQSRLAGIALASLGTATLATLLPVPYAIAVIAGVVASDYNLVEQVGRLQKLTQNSDKSLGTILDQVSYKEVLATGAYTTATGILGIRTQGKSFFGSLANAGGYVADTLTTPGGEVKSKDLALNALFGGVTWTGNIMVNSKRAALFLDDRSMGYWAIGGLSYQLQTIVDNILTDTPIPDNFSARTVVYGLTNFTGRIGNNYYGTVATGLMGLLYNKLDDNDFEIPPILRP